ncbi:hypothetical protein FQN53_009583 [Emmonsiellopsis sp. PD_33]|nr:hypothetical protein FQN53_009583 [Emmonsiellopsis sp. PD_33]
MHPRPPLPPSTPLRPILHTRIRTRISRPRHLSTNPPPPPPNPSRTRTRARLESFNARLPRFLKPYTTPLLNAPVTHITSFLILHEITAIVPLFGLAGLFHYAGWIPALGSGDGAVDEGVRRFGRWLRRKGWVGAEAEGEAEREVEEGVIAAGEGGRVVVGRDRDTADNGVRLILEFATAYAITKALLPVRIVLSVWATPWFARGVLGPVGRGVGRVFGRGRAG